MKLQALSTSLGAFFRGRKVNCAVARRFEATEQDRKCVGDITYIRTREGWLYLSVIQDLYSRRIVGRAMSDSIKSDLVCDAYKMALQHRRPEPGLLFHSDRGVVSMLLMSIRHC